MAETTGTDWEQVKAAKRLGAGAKGQSCDGTFTSGGIPKYDTVAADGTLTDSGILASSISSLIGRGVIGFIINDGSTGTNVGPELIAPWASSISKCKLVTKASDGATDLTFTIKKNGTAVFTSSQTITHGTATGTLTTITALTSVPLSVSADDIFTIDISSGSIAWLFTVQLES
jgi:hypothetical protein